MRAWLPCHESRNENQMCVERCESKFPIGKPHIRDICALTVSRGRFSPWVRKRVGLGTYVRLRVFRRQRTRSEQLQEEAKQENPHTWRVGVHFAWRLRQGRAVRHWGGSTFLEGTPDDDPMLLSFNLRASHSEDDSSPGGARFCTGRGEMRGLSS